MIRINKKVLTHFDLLQPLLVFPIIIISYFLISEANSTLAEKQIVYFTIGFIVFGFFFLLPLRKLAWLIPLVYWINIILLISVEFFGVSKLGAKRWLEFPFIHFTIQPSEILKPAFILMLAYMIKKDPPDENGYNLKQFAKLSFYILLPFFLIAKEPDLGTATILAMVGFGILFVVGVNKKIWIAIAIFFAVSGPFLYSNLHSYQKQRILDFLGEKPSYHVKQSIIAIGSGGISGKDKNDATQTKFKFLPISTSDFIFAYYVERFGFYGAAILILIYALLISHLISINYSIEDDYFTQVLSSGLALMIFIYMSINIAMTVGFAPVVGVPLPFFSYGGSSFVMFMCMFGILENLLTFRYDRMYNYISYKNID